MVIDGAVTPTGSMNWTRIAATNSEDLNLVSSSAVAAAYAAHWRERLAVSVRFEESRALVPGLVADLAAMADEARASLLASRSPATFSPVPRI